MRRLISMLAAMVLAAATLFTTAGAASAGAATVHHRADCSLGFSAHLHITGSNGVNYFLGTPVNTGPGKVVRLKARANSTTNWTFCFVTTSAPFVVILLNRGLALASTQGVGGLVTVATTSAPGGNGFASQRWNATFVSGGVFLQNQNTDLWLRGRNNCCFFGQTVTTGGTPREWFDNF
jgi:hypothetical protein